MNSILDKIIDSLLTPYGAMGSLVATMFIIKIILSYQESKTLSNYEHLVQITKVLLIELNEREDVPSDIKTQIQTLIHQISMEIGD